MKTLSGNIRMFQQPTKCWEMQTKEESTINAEKSALTKQEAVAVVSTHLPTSSALEGRYIHLIS